MRTRDAVQQLWPELDWIGDPGLREKVLATWVKAFEMSPLAPDDLRRAVGSEIVVLESTDPGGLAEAIARRGGPRPQVVDGTVRVEVDAESDLGAARVLIGLVEAFPGGISAARIGRPTLEDVFVHHTGRTLG